MRLFISSLNNSSGGVITPPVMGCTNPLATNYNPLATIDDGSCVFSNWELPENSVRVTVLTGQSNGAGEGLNSSALLTEIDETANMILYRRFTYAFANLNISAGNNYPNNTAKHGLELGMTINHEANYDYPLYLLKWAVGSQELLEFLKGGTVYQTHYNDFIYRGINYLLGLGKRVFVDFVFLQGENDSDFIDKRNAFSDRLDELIALWRDIFGANLPISFIQIYQRNAGTTQINNIFQEKADADENIKVIQASELATNDGIHYSYASLKTIADRYYTRINGVEPYEVTALLPVPTDTTPPATMTLISVTQVGATLTVVADINSGDTVTSNANLYFKLYNSTVTIYHVSGSDSTDANVSISGTVVTITNIPVVYRFGYGMRIVAVDEAGNNSVQSNIITIVPTF
jgi:hypothetical protein